MLNTATDVSYWQFENQQLADSDLIDQLVLSLCDNCHIDYPNPRLHLLLSELVSNAIDHGVLALDSRLKKSTTGFDAYFMERAKRLTESEKGWISVTAERLDIQTLRISVQDSGNGFDYQRLCRELSPGNACNTTNACNTIGDAYDTDQLHGRGLLIINSLCSSVSHIGNGNCTEVEFNLAVV